MALRRDVRPPLTPIQIKAASLVIDPPKQQTQLLSPASPNLIYTCLECASPVKLTTSRNEFQCTDCKRGYCTHCFCEISGFAKATRISTGTGQRSTPSIKLTKIGKKSMAQSTVRRRMRIWPALPDSFPQVVLAAVDGSHITYYDLTGNCFLSYFS